MSAKGQNKSKKGNDDRAFTNLSNDNDGQHDRKLIREDEMNTFKEGIRSDMNDFKLQMQGLMEQVY
jgi:hypothetical protein